MSKTTITLSKPIEIDGGKIDTLTMREPTVGDQLDAEKRKGTPGETEVAMFASLCGQADGVIEKLTLKDYRELQKAYQDFLS